MTQKIAAQRGNVIGGFKHLYGDVLRRQEKEKLPQSAGYTFTPALTNLDPNMFKGVEKPSGKNSVQ